MAWRRCQEACWFEHEEGIVLLSQFQQQLWQYTDSEPLGWWRRAAARIALTLVTVVRKFADGRLSLEATSLAYTTLLALVPLLAVSFSVLTAFGVHNQMEPMLMELLYPLGDKAPEITQQVMAFVENIRVGVLGFVGIAMLIYTVISLLSKIESAFNSIWHVPNARTIARRFSDYLSVVLIGPVLIFSGLGLANTALDSEMVRSFRAIEPFGTLLASFSSLGPYLLVCFGFAFAYGFIPNTRVRIGTALIGGVFTGVLWFVSGKVFATFVTNSSNYSAIYSGFATAVLFIIWIYVGWLIALVGAQLTFYLQNPRFMNPAVEQSMLDGRRREEVALEIMTLIGQAHQSPQGFSWTLRALEARHNNLPVNAVAELIRELQAQGLLVASNEDPAFYLPARSPDTILLADIMRVARGDHKAGSGLASVDKVVDRLDEAVIEALKGQTLGELIRGERNRAKPL